MGRLSFDKLKDFFLGKPEESETPELDNTNADDTDEQAVAVSYTNRHPWGDFSLLQSLTPERLAQILNDVKRGECPAEYMELAEAVERDIVKNSTAKLYALIRDMLDALVKGFSMNEIIWDTDKTLWKPRVYKYRDPRWF
jgi:phage gp29-like protein